MNLYLQALLLWQGSSTSGTVPADVREVQTWLSPDMLELTLAPDMIELTLSPDATE